MAGERRQGEVILPQVETRFKRPSQINDATSHQLGAKFGAVAGAKIDPIDFVLAKLSDLAQSLEGVVATEDADSLVNETKSNASSG